MHADATVSLQDTELSVTEGNSGANRSVDVCVVLQDAMGGLEREITLTFTTTGGTAGMHSDIHK